MDDRHLNQIATRWSLVLAACRRADDPDQAAQAEFLERYVGAIYRYSLRILEDPDLATEACQEFALRFVRGDFHRDEPAALGVVARELEPRECRDPVRSV